VSVLLERSRLGDDVRAYVAIDDGPGVLRARGRDADELLAIRNAFARFDVTASRSGRAELGLPIEPSTLGG
jgi:hypothetical protein